MIQATSDATGALPVIAELATTPSTAALLSALFDLTRDVRRRGAAGGPAQLLVFLSKVRAARGADIAATLNLDQSTVSRHVSALEADGLVRRSPNAADRRVHELELTPLGQDAALVELRRRVAALEAAVADWPQEDIDDLARLLARFTAALHATHPLDPHAPQEGPRT